MNIRKILGLVAAAGLLFIAAPSDKASAMPLHGAAAVQGSVNEALVSEVQYRHRHVRPHRHVHPHRHVRRHRHYVRPPVVRRHHYVPRAYVHPRYYRY